MRSPRIRDVEDREVNIDCQVEVDRHNDSVTYQIAAPSPGAPTRSAATPYLATSF
jgi:hypothetical protein